MRQRLANPLTEQLGGMTFAVREVRHGGGNANRDPFVHGTRGDVLAGVERFDASAVSVAVPLVPLDSGSTYYICKVYGSTTTAWTMPAGTPWRQCTSGTTSGVIEQWYQGSYVRSLYWSAYNGQLLTLPPADIPKKVDCVVALYGGYALVKIFGKAKFSWVGWAAALWSLRTCVA